MIISSFFKYRYSIWRLWIYNTNYISKWIRKNSNAITTNNNIFKTTNASTSILNHLLVKEEEHPVFINE